MTMLTTFLETHILRLLEQAFIAHEPQLQEEFLSQMRNVFNMGTMWIENKLEECQKS
jgi:hypothetical protein